MPVVNSLDPATRWCYLLPSVNGLFLSVRETINGFFSMDFFDVCELISYLIPHTVTANQPIDNSQCQVLIPVLNSRRQSQVSMPVVDPLHDRVGVRCRCRSKCWGTQCLAFISTFISYHVPIIHISFPNQILISKPNSFPFKVPKRPHHYPLLSSPSTAHIIISHSPIHAMHPRIIIRAYPSMIYPVPLH